MVTQATTQCLVDVPHRQLREIKKFINIQTWKSPTISQQNLTNQSKIFWAIAYPLWYQPDDWSRLPRSIYS